MTDGPLTLNVSLTKPSTSLCSSASPRVFPSSVDAIPSCQGLRPNSLELLFLHHIPQQSFRKTHWFPPQNIGRTSPPAPPPPDLSPAVSCLLQPSRASQLASLLPPTAPHCLPSIQCQIMSLLCSEPSSGFACDLEYKQKTLQIACRRSSMICPCQLSGLSTAPFPFAPVSWSYRSPSCSRNLPRLLPLQAFLSAVLPA